MDRRALLTTTGALPLVLLAGCIGNDAAGSGDDMTDGGDDVDNPIPDPSGTPGLRADVSDEALRSLANDNADFGVEVYREAAKNDENLFLSPYSISVALAMTYAGARGDTATEMETVLRFNDPDTVHERFGGLQQALIDRETTDDPGADDDAEVDAFKLRVANALWGQAGVPFAQDFQELIEDYYGAGIAEMAFADDPDGERDRINAWIADQTEDRIEELLPQGSITAQTVLVLTNAIYFLASWESEFDPDETEDGTFYTLDGGESTVPFMTQSARTNYAAIDGAQAVELPYVGGEVSMVFIVPEAGEFEAFETDLSADVLFETFDRLGDHTGELIVPQFEIESELALRQLLTDLGMEVPFSQAADFTGMFDAGGEGVFIDDVYHDAFVTIDEEGTEAAAATAVTMTVSAPPDWGTLRLDRPFLFCIRDRPTDAILFLGRVVDPAA